MLQRQAVKRTTLELLIELMQDKQLTDFILVGGTALALQIGHRDSIDLDMFTKNSFEANELDKYLKDNYGFTQDYLRNNTLKGDINGVKVDLMTHDYPNVQKDLLVEGVRMASLPDIAAMKLNAIIGNGTRIKDFIDIAYLSSTLSLNDMQKAYSQKYPSSNPVMVPKALSYHQDINFKEPIKMIEGRLKWVLIEKRLINMIGSPEKVFSPLNMLDEKKSNDLSNGKGLKM